MAKCNFDLHSLIQSVFLKAVGCDLMVYNTDQLDKITHGGPCTEWVIKVLNPKKYYHSVKSDYEL